MPEKKQTIEQAKQAREGKRKKDEGHGYVGNQFFQVELGKTVIGFSAVNNLIQEAEREELLEGGLLAPHILTKGNAKGQTLTLERGLLSPENDRDAAAIVKALSVGARLNIPITITLCRRVGGGKIAPLRAWRAEGGVVTKREIGSLNALGSEILIEKLEISHAGLQEEKV